MFKLKKADEMELFINNKALKNAYIYIFLFLAFMTFYEKITRNEGGIFFFLFITQSVVLNLSKLYYTKKINKHNEE